MIIRANIIKVSFLFFNLASMISFSQRPLKNFFPQVLVCVIRN